MPATPMTPITYAVTGMTCGHCAAAVTEEVSALPGVTDVAVDVEKGRVTVTADAPLGEDTVREAVEEAGFELVGTA
ncbi:heavy-metal-associated domain-containing protein [soil metagenome]